MYKKHSTQDVFVCTDVFSPKLRNAVGSLMMTAVFH